MSIFKRDIQGMLQYAMWLLKQLFPLTYRTWYIEAGQQHFCVWQMWFGHSFNIDDVIVANYPKEVAQ